MQRVKRKASQGEQQWVRLVRGLFPREGEFDLKRKTVNLEWRRSHHSRWKEHVISDRHRAESEPDTGEVQVPPS